MAADGSIPRRKIRRIENWYHGGQRSVIRLSVTRIEHPDKLK